MRKLRREDCAKYIYLRVISQTYGIKAVRQRWLLRVMEEAELRKEKGK